MLLLCYSYVLVCTRTVTRMYSYVARMYSYVTRMYSCGILVTIRKCNGSLAMGKILCCVTVEIKQCLIKQRQQQQQRKETMLKEEK